MKLFFHLIVYLWLTATCFSQSMMIEDNKIVHDLPEDYTLTIDYFDVAAQTFSLPSGLNDFTRNRLRRGWRVLRLFNSDGDLVGHLSHGLITDSEKNEALRDLLAQSHKTIGYRFQEVIFYEFVVLQAISLGALCMVNWWTARPPNT